MRGLARRGVLALLTAAFLVVPAPAIAATVVNGDFESGTLDGWHVHRVTEAGNWFAYKGTEAPIGRHRNPPASPVQAPPQGDYAAVTDEANPDTLMLWQDVALEPGRSQQLSLLAYYDSYEPIAVPAPDTLSVEEEALSGQHNQQFRIDLMKPGAPLESLDPADILLNVFQTGFGAPESMPPTKLTADLTPFAGQTVRLRIANAVHEEVFNAGVDAVSIGNPSAPASGGSRFRLGRPRPNPGTGVVALPVHVPSGGVVAARGGGRIKPLTVKAPSVGTVTLHLNPTASARQVLKRRHRLRIRVSVAYTPAGGPRETKARSVLFRLR